MAEPPKREGARAAGEALRLVLIASAAQLVSLALNVLLRGALGPTGMGYVVILQLALTFAMFGGLGSLQAVEREIPIELGRGRVPDALGLEFAALAISLIGSSVAALALLAISSIEMIAVDSTLSLVLRVSAVAIVIQQLTLVGIVHQRTRLRFRMVAWFNGMQSVGTVGVLWVGAVIAGVIGASLALLGLTMASAAFMIWVAGLRPHRASLAWFRRVGALAPSFLLSNLAVMALLTVDQLAVGLLLGGPALGTYSAALLGRGFVLGFPSMASSVIYPRLQLELGATADARSVARLAARVTALTAVLMPVVVAAFYILLPPLIRTALPAFAEALAPLRLLLLSAGALAFGIPATQVLLTLNRQWLEALITLIVVALVCVAYGALAIAGAVTLWTIAAAIAGASVVHALWVHRAAARTVDMSFAVTLRYAVVHMLPLVVLLAADASATRLLASASPGWAVDVGIAVVELVTFCSAWLVGFHLVPGRDPQLREDVAMLVSAARARLSSG